MPGFKRFCKTALIEPHFFVMDKLWKLKQEKALYKALALSQDYLIVSDIRELDNTWLAYMMGYIRNAGFPHKKVYFYLYGNTHNLPAWLKEFPVIKTISGFHKAWRKQYTRWKRKADKEIASKRILDMGYYLTENDFFASVTEGDLFLFSLYLEAGFNPNSEDKDGVPILCHIIRMGYSQFIPRLISWGADINRMAHDRANTPIMEAASKGLIDVIQLLIENGAELNHQSKSGQTALILAVGNGQIDAARMILEAGANFSFKDHLGMSAQKYASLYGYQDLLELMERMKE